MFRPYPNNFKVIQCFDHATILAQNLLTLYRDNELFDVTLIAAQDPDNFKIECHRVILSMSSKFFLAMFRNPMKEAQSKEIELNIDGTTLKELLNFIYTGSIELRNDTVEKVLEAAGLYELENLKTICCNFIEGQLDAENCLGVAHLAELHGYNQLLKISFAFACNHFEKVSTGKEFLELHEQQVKELISSDDVRVDSKDILIKSVVAWVEHDKENREKYSLDLLSQVNSLDYIKHSLMSLDPIKTLGFAYDADQQTNGFTVQLYNRESGEWTYKIWPSPLRPRSQYSVTVVKNHLFIVGGLIGNMPTSTVECLDLKTLNWTDIPAMERPRYWPASALMGEKLYVMGRHNGSETRWSVESCSFNGEIKWTKLGRSSRTQFGIARVVALNGLLYVAFWNSRCIEYFDPYGATWDELPRYTTLVNFGMTELNGCLYLVGGEEEMCGKRNNVERYDPSKHTWIKVMPMNLARSHVVCTTLNKRLIVYGGLDGDGKEIDIMEEYDPETNDWTVLPSLLPHKYKKIPSPLFTF